MACRILRAGVSVGAPYRYFSSKEQIILEIAGDAGPGLQQLTAGVALLAP